MNDHLTGVQITKLKSWLNDFNRELLEKRTSDNDAYYWKTLETGQGTSIYTADRTLYKGNCGIVLYLISYYKHSGEVEYLELAKRTTAWLIERFNTRTSEHFALYTGETGLCYVLVELHGVTKETHYLETALELVVNNQERFADHYSDDLLSGNAGNMLALASLYQQTKNTAVEYLLLRCFDDLIGNIQLSKKGLKWRYRPNFIDSLCGLSHGASGIGLALTEIGNAFKASGLTWLGQQAFDYEDQYYMPASLSWPDFRIHPKKLENPDSVPDPDMLMKGEEVSGWAHGSVGIALARLRAYLHTGRESYRQQVEIIANHVMELPDEGTTNFSLTNGRGADALLLAYAGYHLGNKAYVNKAFEIVQKAVELKTECGFLPSGWDAQKPELSVFMGETGLACCMLQLLHPQQADTVILPSFSKTESTGNIAFPTEQTIIDRLFAQYFPETSRAVQGLGSMPETSSVYEFFDSLEAENLQIRSHEMALNKAIFEVEKRKMELEVHPPSFGFLSECHRRIQGTSTPFSPNRKYLINPYTALVESEDTSRILVKYRYGVSDYSLNPFTSTILRILDNQTMRLDEILKNLQSLLAENTDEDKTKQVLLTQLKHLYENGIIRQVD